LSYKAAVSRFLSTQNRAQWHKAGVRRGPRYCAERGVLLGEIRKAEGWGWRQCNKIWVACKSSRTRAQGRRFLYELIGASRQSLTGPHVKLDSVKRGHVPGVMNRRAAESGLEVYVIWDFSLQIIWVKKRDSCNAFERLAHRGQLSRRTVFVQTKPYLTDRARSKGSAPSSSSPDIIIIVSPVQSPSSYLRRDAFPDISLI